MDDNHPLDSLLRELPSCPAPAFTDEVMKRVAGVPQVKTSPWMVADSEIGLSCWTRAILQPSTILALILAALTGEILLLAGGLGELMRNLAAWSLALPSLAAIRGPAVPILVTIAGSALVAFAGYRWSPILSLGKSK